MSVNPLPSLVSESILSYQNNELFIEQVPFMQLAEKFGTPLYVYSKTALREAWERYQEASQIYPLLVCYGMKANSNLAVLNLFAQWGSGFDIVSGGELARALKAGADPQKIVFSGVGKLAWEIEAALTAKIKCFNVESISELKLIDQIAQKMQVKAPVSLRINPDVDAQTHPYISTGLKDNKFGIAMEEAVSTYEKAKQLDGLTIVGLDCHIGSQITQISPYLDALDRLIALIKELKTKEIELEHLDLGGGLGIRYHDEKVPHPKELVQAIADRLKTNQLDYLELVLEPGRSLVGNAGFLLTQVIYTKSAESKNFAIIDAAMNDLLRPTLYDAYHAVVPVIAKTGDALTYDVVGPVCETGDWLAKDRSLVISESDYLVLESAGAYSFVMGSQYNTRARAAEVMVSEKQYYLVREREQIEELYQQDRILPEDF